jgi:non-specific protein-tyrosine kinase
MEPHAITQPRITDYTRPLISRWWLIVVAVVVATGGVYAYYSHKPNVYTTSTLVYVTQPGNPVTGVTAPTPTDRDVSDAAALLDSRANAAAVASRIGFSGSPDALLGQVSITSKQGQDFVQITAQSGSPQQAAAIANTFANQFVDSLTNAYKLQLGDAIRLAKSQLAAAPAGPAGVLARGSLTNQIYTLQQAQAVPATVAKQINLAAVPSAPSSPKPVRNAIFALILSLVGAIALAYGLERFDRRLRNPQEMEEAYGSPLLAVLPHSADPAPALEGAPSLGRDFREPFRVLRTNVELASVDAPPRTIVVSSAMPGEGKSTVVRNLGLAFRESGKRVVVVDLDLRHPTLGRQFGAPIGPGITDVMRHERGLDEVTIHLGVSMAALDDLFEARVPGAQARNGSNGHNGNVAQDHTIALLLSGAIPANPPAVLASERIVQVLDDLRERYDIVLIDSAPLLAVTDSVPLLRYADASLFVGRLGVTTRDTAKRLVEFLDRVPGVNLLGIVANDLSRTEAAGYGYGYGYGYGSPGAEPSFRLGRRKTANDRAKSTV